MIFRPTMVQKNTLPIPSSALARISKRPLPRARVCGIPKLGPYSSCAKTMHEIEHASLQAKRQAQLLRFHCSMKDGKP